MVKIAEHSSSSIQQHPRQDAAWTSAMTSALTSDFWRCAPCRVFAMPDAMPSDMIMIMTLGPYGYGFFSFCGGHTRAFGIGGHTDTPRGSKGLGDLLTPSGKNSEQPFNYLEWLTTLELLEPAAITRKWLPLTADWLREKARS